MTWRNTSDDYGRGSRLAHWLTLLLLCGSFGLGWVMHDMDVSPLRLKLFSYHKWIGVTVVGLVALRLFWRWYSHPPPLPAQIPQWQQQLAGYTHGFLYLLLFLTPLSGWLMSSAKGFQTVYFGVLPIPDLIGKDVDLGKTLEDVHETLTWLLLSVILLHVAAALKHHFVDRDGVLARMIPALRNRRN